VRLVLDTNLLVSFAINPTSAVAEIVNAILGRHAVLYSSETIAELVETFSKPKLAKYLKRQDVEALIAAYLRTGEEVTVSHAVVACRDPKDDKFLSVAVAGRADAIVTGDDDLLVLHPFRGIDILRPVMLVERL
jgi:uncharacterized protein